jgi:hypothetical protein
MIGDHIYWLEPLAKEDERLEYTDDMVIKMTPCPRNPEHAMSMRRTNPLRVQAPLRPWADVLWTFSSDCLITTPVKNALIEAGVTGIAFGSVETFTTKGDRFETYELHELKITGWGGMAPASSGVRVIEECPHCHRRVFSRFTNPVDLFDIERWDGSDVFIIWPLPRYIMLVGSVRNILLKNRFSGLRLRPIADLPMDALVNTLTPGQPADWFESGRVRDVEREVEQGLRSDGRRG